ncbi:MAG TPA: hypothetical protein PLV92_19000 [Pirellulaceae bacterium]|nr:hypothetical protein [Pirellulaceae bacterium]
MHNEASTRRRRLRFQPHANAAADGAVELNGELKRELITGSAFGV